MKSFSIVAGVLFIAGIASAPALSDLHVGASGLAHNYPQWQASGTRE